MEDEWEEWAEAGEEWEQFHVPDPAEAAEYQQGTVWITQDDQYEPDADDERFEAIAGPSLQVISNAIVLRRYATAEQVREQNKKYTEELERQAKLNPPKKEPEEELEWVEDELYGLIQRRKAPEVDPNLLNRESEPIVWTPEDIELYGPFDDPEHPTMPHDVPSTSQAGPSNYAQSMAAMSLNDTPQASGPDPGGSDDTDGSGDDDGKQKLPAKYMDYYDENFRLIPGDVIMYTKQRLSPTPESPYNTLCMIHIYSDPYYFEDNGQYRHIGEYVGQSLLGLARALVTRIANSFPFGSVPAFLDQDLGPFSTSVFAFADLAKQNLCTFKFAPHVHTTGLLHHSLTLAKSLGQHRVHISIFEATGLQSFKLCGAYLQGTNATLVSNPTELTMQNFMDLVPLEDGDMVIRFGNFNKKWLWNRHAGINVFTYTKNVKPPRGYGKKKLNPWWWIANGLLQYEGSYGPPLPISKPLVPPNTPIGTKMKDFKLRNGDLLMHFDQTDYAPPFDADLSTHMWNPVLENIGQRKFERKHDRVIRHGIDFQYEGMEAKMGICVIHVELFYLDQYRNWRFLGSCTTEFTNLLKREPLIWGVGHIPLAGDIVFDRSIRRRKNKTARWDPELNIGGVISFHTYETYKFLGREVRSFVWYRDPDKYGKGNITMVLRMGYFVDNVLYPYWDWRHAQTLNLFILNSRGSSWRLHAQAQWPANLPWNRPNYDWKPYNPNNVREVSPHFGPQAGDVIIRIMAAPLEERMRLRDPAVVGSTFNPHYQVKAIMCVYGPHYNTRRAGDFIIRAGYEVNKVNPMWTNATVECYNYDSVGPGGELVWQCRGRDVFVFGTNYMKGGLEGVQSSGFGDYSVADIEKINAYDYRPVFGEHR